MAGVIKSHVQLGDSNTATNNFMLTAQAADGTMKLARGNNGATTQDIITVDANGFVTLAQGKQLTLATAQNTTSGTSIDFTNIPSWVKRITLIHNGVSTNGSSSLIVQIGSGSIDTSGYTGAVSFLSTSAVSTGVYSSTGYQTANNFAGGQLISGHVVLTLISGNIWVLSSNLGDSGGVVWVGGGTKTLAGTLDRLRLTTVGGVNTFDAGSVNIIYEG